MASLARAQRAAAVAAEKKSAAYPLNKGAAVAAEKKNAGKKAAEKKPSEEKK